jgi:hypothetical protein
MSEVTQQYRRNFENMPKKALKYQAKAKEILEYL